MNYLSKTYTFESPNPTKSMKINELLKQNHRVFQLKKNLKNPDPQTLSGQLAGQAAGWQVSW